MGRRFAPPDTRKIIKMFDILNETSSKLPQNSQITSFETGVVYIINWGFTFVFFLSAAGIIYSGIQMIMSKGDPKAMGVAKTAFTYSIVGLVIGIGAVAIVNIISNTLGATFR